MGNSRSVVTKMATVGILLVLVFVVLSTATYAWYTTNIYVSTENITFRSSASDSQGGVSIGPTKTSVGTNITFDAIELLSPMVPSVKGISGETRYADFMDFRLSYEISDEFGHVVAQLDGEATEPCVLGLDGQKYFYVNNRTDADVTLFVNYELKGELRDKLNIAMFVGESDPRLLCIMTEGDVHYGDIKKGEPVSEMPSMTGIIAESGEKFITVPANDSICVRLITWLDGVNMKDKNSNKTTEFTVSFDA